MNTLQLLLMLGLVCVLFAGKVFIFTRIELYLFQEKLSVRKTRDTSDFKYLLYSLYSNFLLHI